MRYALLLRGINVGGKNKVGMNRLKSDLMELGFSNVVSYINSGNLFFDSTESEEVIRCRLERYFDATYEFPIPFIIVGAVTLRQEVDRLPDWWQDEAAYRRTRRPLRRRRELGRMMKNGSILDKQPSFTAITVRQIISNQIIIRSCSRPGFTNN